MSATAATALPPPPVRACLFDMDGLLLNTEDIYTLVTNTLLHELGRPSLPWHIKAQLQGRPFAAASAIFQAWAQLPIPMSEYQERQAALQQQHFPSAAPLPGVTELLQTLAGAKCGGGGGAGDGAVDDGDSEGVEMALATSSQRGNFMLKTAHVQELFSVFPVVQQVLGDDPRIPPGRGKPAPDIYLLALRTINERRAAEHQAPIRPEECLVFEDAVPGIEAGRRAGMQVVWVPHPGLREEYRGREEQVLAGACGEAEEGEGMGSPGTVGDGWSELRSSLEDFDYGRYGIKVKP